MWEKKKKHGEDLKHREITVQEGKKQNLLVSFHEDCYNLMVNKLI